jgi:hypothetical protein
MLSLYVLFIQTTIILRVIHTNYDVVKASSIAHSMLHKTSQHNLQQLSNFRQTDDQRYSRVTGQFVAKKCNMSLVNDSALATEITLKYL